MKKYIRKVAITIVIIIICFVYNMTLHNVKATTNVNQSLSDGIYTIKSKINSNYVVDVLSASMNNCANIQLWQNADVPQQRFYVKYLSNGYYTLTAMHSNKVIDVAGAGKISGTNVQQYESNGTDAQQWLIKDEGNGFYSISSKCNGLYLDVSCGIASNGRNVQVYSNNGTDAQKFAFEKYSESTTQDPGEKTIENGNYLIQPNDNYALDIDSYSIDNCANVQLWSSVASKNQIFKVEYLNDGYYKITSLNSNKVLDVKGGKQTLGTNVQQYEANGTDAQSWVIKDAGGGYYNIISKCNKLYMDISGGVLQNGSNIQVYTGNGTDAQKFKFEKVSSEIGTQTMSDGTYIIESSINNEYVLDISAASKDNGANVQIWSNVSAPQQKFKLTYIGNGYYKIININSKKSLDVVGGNRLSGTNVQQYDYNGTTAQQWIIKDVGNGYYNIISNCAGLYLDISNGTAINGTNVQVDSPNDSTAQKFKFVKTTEGIDLDTARYPGYKEKIDALMDAHPNWNFKLLYTGLTFANAVNGEASVSSRNLVPTSYGGEWINGYTLYDSGWYAASSKAIAYYMDPRNFLDNTNIFQFTDANGYPSGISTSNIQSEVNNTFLANYANDISTASANQGVNPFYILSRLFQEQGKSGTTIGKGMDGGDGSTYYNPFNIGASGTGYNEIYANALATAKSYGWNTMETGLEGGITFCKKNWLNNYQNTLYQNRFDIDSTNGTSLYSHQYMQNLMGAYSEARNMKSMYSDAGCIDSNLTFIIPLYEQMDSNVLPIPSSSSESYPMDFETTGTNVRLRSSTDTSSNSNIICELTDSGTKLISAQRGVGSDWQKVITTDGKIGYVSCTYLTSISTQTNCNYTATVKTNDGNGCKVRIGPSTDLEQLTAISDGTTVTVINTGTYNNINGYNWYRVVLNSGEQGFMPSNYLK